ncbi:protein SPO16 homolog [Salarias fasciatus]|uniref:protein SPO16 homolog n=1 Tax=Salarias fasciatus TaxID=181472 RepID=UPI0011767EA1|nr:uncharacterized protein C1orf146 homolog [Salarias fasciatus]
MAALSVRPPPWKTNIIISSTLQEHEISGMLTAGQQHRLRLSDSIQPGVIIFPQSGTAFLLVEAPVLPDRESELIGLIEKFVQIHRNHFVVLRTPVDGNAGPDALTLIQTRFFGSNLKVLPVQSNAEVVRGILKIAKATSKPYVDLLQRHMSLAVAHIIETSNVWEVHRDAV